MVSSLSIAAMIFSILLSVLLPIGAAVYFKIRRKISFAPTLAGVAVFFLFVLMVESFVNSYLIQSNAVTAAIFKNPWAYSAYAAFAAGFFEESGRLIAFFFLLKNYRGWNDGIAYGIGHGGLEALIIGGLYGVNNLAYAVIINTGTFDATIGKALSPSAAQHIKTAIVGTSPALFAMAGVERVCAFLLQMALSMLVLYAVANRKYIFVLCALLIHFAVDFPAALSQKGILPLWTVEGIVLIFAVLSVLFVIRSKKLFVPSDGARPADCS